MSETETSPDEPVTVYTINDFYAAEIIKAALQSEGIRCDLDGQRQAGLTEILPIGLIVRARDADRARKIILSHETRHRRTHESPAEHEPEEGGEETEK